MTHKMAHNSTHTQHDTQHITHTQHNTHHTDTQTTRHTTSHNTLDDTQHDTQHYTHTTRNTTQHTHTEHKTLHDTQHTHKTSHTHTNVSHANTWANVAGCCQGLRLPAGPGAWLQLPPQPSPRGRLLLPLPVSRPLRPGCVAGGWSVETPMGCGFLRVPKGFVGVGHESPLPCERSRRHLSTTSLPRLRAQLSREGFFTCVFLHHPACRGRAAFGSDCGVLVKVSDSHSGRERVRRRPWKGTAMDSCCSLDIGRQGGTP
ncbi:unnamed protein product [Natator depressus]